jgi:hypothetical protein
MTTRALFKKLMLIATCVGLTACVAKDINLSEQQKRMQRCDQYIDRARDDCLRGETITIDDYKDDFRAYERSRAREAENNKPKIEPFIQSQKDNSAEKPAIDVIVKPVKEDGT